MLGEFFNAVADELCDSANEISTRCNKGILKGAWSLASTRMTLDAYGAMAQTIAAPAPGF
jgi:hypothetical protein